MRTARQSLLPEIPLVKFNSHWNPQNLHVTVFVQEKKSREILGAGSTRIKG